MQKRATIRDVARLAGVSVSTVSVALNRNSKVRVSERMRHRILEVVRQLKYRPAGVGRPADFRRNPQLRSAREKLAVLVDGVYDSLGDNIYSQVQRGIGIAAAPAGKEVVLLNESSGYLPYGTVGVIIIGAPSADKLRLAGDRPQVRAMGLLDSGENCDHVTYNNREMARLGAEYLIGRHDCIGCLCYNGREIFMQRYEIMKRMIRAAGKRLGVFAGTFEAARGWYDKGFDMTIINSELAHLGSAISKEMPLLRQAIGEPR